MAKVKLGTIVVGIRGTIGGITFTANASGPHARLWSKPNNPATTGQQRTRGRQSTYGQLWQSMTPTLRANWRTFAVTPPEHDYNSLGEQIWPTGWQWFCRIQQRRESVGAAVSTTVPATGAATAPASVTLTATQLPGGAVDVAWPAGTFPAGTAAILLLAVHASSGLLNKTTGHLLALSLTNPPSIGQDISTNVQALWGSIRTGWTLYGRLYLQRADAVRSTFAATTIQVS